MQVTTFKSLDFLSQAKRARQREVEPWNVTCVTIALHSKQLRVGPFSSFLKVFFKFYAGDGNETKDIILLQYQMIRISLFNLFFKLA